MCAMHRGLAGGLAIALLWSVAEGVFAQEAKKDASLQDSIKANAEQTALDLGGGAKLELVLIRPGSFTMGDETGDDDEKPVHKVTITKPFYIGKYKVTQQQWKALMGNNPSNVKEPKNPVERVTWEDCQGFLKKLNEKFGDKTVKFSFPTERNGSMPVGRARPPSIASATRRPTSAATPGFSKTRKVRSIPSAKRSRTRGASTTCMATLGNGAPIGTTRPITKRRPPTIPPVPLRALSASAAAAVGKTWLPTAAARFASSLRPRTISPISACGWCAAGSGRSNH